MHILIYPIVSHFFWYFAKALRLIEANALNMYFPRGVILMKRSWSCLFVADCCSAI